MASVIQRAIAKATGLSRQTSGAATKIEKTLKMQQEESHMADREVEMANSQLYDPIKTMATITDTVLVGFSGGKDSAACLDLCFKYFKNVYPFFMYIVPNLDFQERTLNYYEKRYNMEIIRVPHFMLSDFLRYGTYRIPDLNVPMVKTVELYNYLREKTGAHWICAGERIADSIVRRAMIKESSSIDTKRGRFYPIAYWNVRQVRSYNKQRKLPLSLENKKLKHSFRSLMPSEVANIKQIFPSDYEKIKEMFPLVEASVKKGEFYGNS